MGAEATLARMLYEHETSSHYTPVKLGEIMGNRCMDKDGKRNTFAEKTKDKVLGIHVSSGGFALQEEDVHNPRSMGRSPTPLKQPNGLSYSLSGDPRSESLSGATISNR